jgi:hypothetical protein
MAAPGRDFSRNVQGVGVGNRLEVIARAKQLDRDQDPTERGTQEGSRDEQQSGQPDRTDNDVRDRRCLHRLLDHSYDDWLSGL